MKTFYRLLGGIAAVVFLFLCVPANPFVDVGVMMDPPHRSTSIYVNGYGKPLPVFASNTDPRIGPIGYKVFWGTVGLYGIGALGSGALVAVSFIAFTAIWRRIVRCVER